MFRNVPEDGTIEIWINTIDLTGAPVAPSSAFAASDFAIHKDGSATEKTSTNGITVTSPFDTETGLHLVQIDTSNDTGDAGFWATGSRYSVRFNTAKTVDSVSIDGRLVPQGQFGIDSEAVTEVSVDAILADTNELQTNQGNWLTATGFSTHSAADVADAVWDEATADHVAAGSMGLAVGTSVSAGTVADAVWDELSADHVIAGSFGLYLDSKISGMSTTTLSQPVATGGQITAPIVIGDDYLSANGRAFEWDITAITGVTIGTASCQLGFAHPKKGSFSVTGTLSDNGDGTWKMSFDITRSDSAGIEEGCYEWSAQVTDASGNELTRVRNDGDNYQASFVAKQT